ncbi:nitroreductase family protein [Pedobacter montanisoli]|uniref:Nitroreductase n=1 Tax=Pedobacter montanisoli TaxID=2923277 RepID=A0ABS9ZXI7_9SPHI|nr:nitroreductase [Pedobacter montanisoli]MCJ0743023.1 nitroreductase [Pedobacter montanisoli]
MSSNSEILAQIIKNRRSVFTDSYIEKEIPRGVIEQILESANYAPTHKLTQPWRFIVIRKEAKLRLGEELAAIYKSTTTPEKFLQKKHDSFTLKTQKADCILALNVQYHPDKLPAWEELAAMACAVQNMALTAESLNVGAYWSSPGMIEHLGKFLELNENEKCYGLFYMGYHNEQAREANRTPMIEKVKWMES